MNVTFAKKYVRKLLLIVLPPHSRQHKAARLMMSKVGLLRPQVYTDSEYLSWIKNNEPNTFLHVDTQEQSKKNPLISLVIPFWNTSDAYLNDLMRSLESQVFKNWELILVDVSDISARSEAIKDWSEKNENYRYIKLDKNYDISTNTNKGIDIARGNYIAFADHDDTLSPFAMNEVAHTIHSQQPDIIYSDEDKITDNGKTRHSPYFKPDWSPHLFLFTNYTNHLSVIKKSLIESVGGLNKHRNGSQDYDLLLRIHANSKEPLIVAHIPKILYHWREAAQSTARDHTKKSYAFVAGRDAVESHLQTLGIAADTTYITNSPGFYKQVFNTPANANVTIIINDKFSAETKTKYQKGLIDLTKTNLSVSFVGHKDEGKKNDYTVEINELCLPLSVSWLDELIGIASQGDVETVAPRLLDSTGTKVANAGTVKHPYFPKFSEYGGLCENEHTPTGGAWWVRDVEVVPAWVTVKKNRDVTDPNLQLYQVVWSHVDFKMINE